MTNSRNPDTPAGSPVADAVDGIVDARTTRTLLALLRTGPLAVVCLLVLTAGF